MRGVISTLEDDAESCRKARAIPKMDGQI